MLPRLRQRLEDIPVLVEHFSRQVAEQNGWKPIAFQPEAIDELKRYHWPGNVRELRNVVERLMLLSEDGRGDRRAVEMAVAAAAGGAAAARQGTLAERVGAIE